ncbi:hypothetical protein NC651_017567 [Populus alba x Populus x berolinensis]|nr:hypothetical protein NC651_017567 [Populus alba x Populus x berolinensis]
MELDKEDVASLPNNVVPGGTSPAITVYGVQFNWSPGRGCEGKERERAWETRRKAFTGKHKRRRRRAKGSRFRKGTLIGSGSTRREAIEEKERKMKRWRGIESICFSLNKKRNRAWRFGFAVYGLPGEERWLDKEGIVKRRASLA